MDPHDDAARAKWRARIVCAALPSLDLSGLPVDRAALEDAAEYVDGQISLGEWGDGFGLATVYLPNSRTPESAS